MPAKETRTVATRIPNSTAEQIDLIVQVSGVTYSKVVASLIERGLKATRDARNSGKSEDDSFTALLDEETKDE